MMNVTDIIQDTNETQTLEGVTELFLFKRSNISVTVLTSGGLSIEAAAGNVSYILLLYCLVYCVY